jgi:hypothetical protein
MWLRAHHPMKLRGWKRHRPLLISFLVTSGLGWPNACQVTAGTQKTVWKPNQISLPRPKTGRHLRTIGDVKNLIEYAQTIPQLRLFDTQWRDDEDPVPLTEGVHATFA